MWGGRERGLSALVLWVVGLWAACSRYAFHSTCTPSPTRPPPGDGTTTVVVMCGSLLDQCSGLLEKGIHPTVITEAFGMAAVKAEEVLTGIAVPVDLADRAQLIKAAQTSLASKVVSQNSEDLAPLAVDAVLSIIDPATAVNADLNNVRIVKALGGTIDETELVAGLVFTNKASHVGGAPTRIANAKIGLAQFCFTAPKTDIENQVVVSEYAQMDRLLKEERRYILDMCKKVRARAGRVGGGRSAADGGSTAPAHPPTYPPTSPTGQGERLQRAACAEVHPARRDEPPLALLPL